MLKDQAKAKEMLEQIDIASFPHIIDKDLRKGIIERYTSALPKPPVEPLKPATEQYEALKMRMRGR